MLGNITLSGSSTSDSIDLVARNYLNLDKELIQADQRLFTKFKTIHESWRNEVIEVLSENSLWVPRGFEGNVCSDRPPRNITPQLKALIQYPSGNIIAKIINIFGQSLRGSNNHSLNNILILLDLL